MVDDSQAKTSAHAVLAAVLQVRDGGLQALLWQRAREPFAECWALPGGALAAEETLEEAMRRDLGAEGDGRGGGARGGRPAASRWRRRGLRQASPRGASSLPRFSGWCRAGWTRRCRSTRAGTRS